MNDFKRNLTKVGRSNLDGISPGREKIKIRFALKNWMERLVLILTNVFYLPNSSFNFDRLNLLNDAVIYHYNEDQIIYDLKIHKIFVFVERYNTNFLLYLSNLSAAAVNPLKNSKFYKEEALNVNQTKEKKLSVIH